MGVVTAALLIAACGGDEQPGSGGSAGHTTATGGAGGAGGAGGGVGGSGGGGASGAATAGLGVSADGHWLEYGGRSVLLAGDSVTQGWMELGGDFDQVAYLDALASRGIDVLMLWSFIGVVDQPGDGRIGYDAPERWPWVFDGSSFDLGSFDEAYFQDLRDLVSGAGARGVAVLLTVHDGWTKTRCDGHPFNVALGGPLTAKEQYVALADYGGEMPASFEPSWSAAEKHQYYLERFCDRLIAATGDRPNIMYEMFNEGEWYDQTDLRAFELHFLDFFKQRTAQPLLINDDHVAGADFRGEPLADLLSLHQPNWSTSSSAKDAFDHYAPEFAASPAKPFFFSEPVPSFDGGSGQRDAMMRLMWGTLLGGAGFVVQNDTSFGFAPAAAMVAQAAERDGMLDLEGHAARLFTEIVSSLDGFAPDGSACSTGVCLVRPGEIYLAYLQDGASLTVDLSAASGQLEARFYDPRAGSFAAPPISVTGGAPSEPFQAPATGDWVLVVAKP